MFAESAHLQAATNDPIIRLHAEGVIRGGKVTVDRSANITWLGPRAGVNPVAHFKQTALHIRAAYLNDAVC